MVLLGIRSYVTLMVEPTHDWRQAAELAQTKLGDACGKVADYRKVFIYDACGRCDRPTLAGRGLRQFPPFDATHFEGVSQAVLMEDGGGKSLFGENDLFFAKDGRRSGTSQKMSKALRQATKDASGYNKKPLSSPFRLIYSNHEFGPTGYAGVATRTAGAGRACLPDLLETGYFISKKTARTPVRQRKWIDLPGSNSTRGLAGLTLKSEIHHGIQVHHSTLKTIQESTEAVDGRDVDVEAAPLELTAEDDKTAEAAEATQQQPSGGLVWFPWSTGEAFWREFLHLYAHEKGPALTGVIDFTVGCGLLALASARSGIRYCGFVLNECHREAVLQSLTVAVSLEIARNVNDGFLKRRVLSRERSLGGSTDCDVKAAEDALAATADADATGSGADAAGADVEAGATDPKASSSSSDSE